MNLPRVMAGVSIVGAYFVGLTCVNGILGATLAGYSSHTNSAADSGGGVAEQTAISLAAAVQNHMQGLLSTWHLSPHH